MGTPQSGAAAAMKKEVAERITNALITKNVPATVLAERTDMSVKQIRSSLKGDRSLTVEELHQIADAIEVMPSSLIPGWFPARDAA